MQANLKSKWNYNFQVKYSLTKLEIEFLTKLIFVKEREGWLSKNKSTNRKKGEKHQAQMVSQVTAKQSRTVLTQVNYSRV